MELNSEMLKVLGQGGFTLIMFVVWYLTYRSAEKRYTEQLEKQNEFIKQLFKQMEEDLQYKQLLTGILNRIEVKLDTNKLMKGN